MAADVDRHGQAGNVGRVHLDVDGQGRLDPAEPLGPDPEPVDLLAELFLQRPDVGPRVALVDGADDGLLGEAGGQLKAAADADADDERRARLRSRPVHRLHHKPLDALDPVGRGQHRSEEHTSELQSRENLVCRLLLEKKNRADLYMNWIYSDIRGEALDFQASSMTSALRC